LFHHLILRNRGKSYNMNHVVSVGGDNEHRVSILRPVLNTLLRYTGQSVILTLTIHIPSLGLPHKCHVLCGWHTISERVHPRFLVGFVLLDL